MTHKVAPVPQCRTPAVRREARHDDDTVHLHVRHLATSNAIHLHCCWRLGKDHSEAPIQCVLLDGCGAHCIPLRAGHACDRVQAPVLGRHIDGFTCCIKCARSRWSPTVTEKDQEGPWDRQLQRRQVKEARCLPNTFLSNISPRRANYEPVTQGHIGVQGGTLYSSLCAAASKIRNYFLLLLAGFFGRLGSHPSPLPLSDLRTCSAPETVLTVWP